jgi:hypothetical protein
MKKLFKWIWVFVPQPAKAWVIVTGVVLILGVLGFSVYKIQDWGYDRCQTKHDNAANKLKDDSRKEILKAEKQYEKIKTEIIKIQGDNGIAGPRTQLAIDSMPRPSGR